MTDDMENNGQTEDISQSELDDIDQFLNSLHIPNEMINDIDKPITTLKTRPPVTIANIFPLLAWVVFIIAMFSILNAAPPGTSFFNNLLSVSSAQLWDRGQLFAAMCYLFGNCVVCAGGLIIRFHKKIRLTSIGTIHLLILAAASAVISVMIMLR